ncbi:phenylalanine--tRNA ligase subunit beta [Catalinimonas niigatensis]|uniref:phenylalanine--tRNA ligase subunit beta n=1 Tax=Catalinimonas niigatensis TaxID=1397264 RepID=UPI0026668484|nr:phenylalanine--tRNA ligase subunit beta [Catalinimonas niigatensis]WPP48283.1 phenylalanine--tRNA ligase subunit beta [Catalinimonas niigatensis]
MKISVNWLKDYISFKDKTEEIAHMLTMSGLEVEGIEVYEQVPGGLRGLVVGEVLTAEPHPNADRLRKTTVDIGNREIKPIVCGAPNVAAGQKVVVATVGTMLYPAEGDPFEIKKAKIRGEVSEGMICAEDEIGLSASHEGIMVLDTDLPNGTPAAQYFNVYEDQVLEIGLTPNRADAASHIGVARDLRALLRKDLQWPSVDDFAIDNDNLPIQIKVENIDACPRYSGITISGVTVKKSPEWLQQRLQAIGLTPINNIVDITNFVLHEVGQPLHAFDADAITGGKVIVKTLAAGSTFTTLDGKERKLQAEDLMICNAKEGMCIAGVFGGMKSGVKESTRNIFLESAYFSPEYIRRTAQHHSLKTDASFRYERGTDPRITVYALKRAAMLIKEWAGGSISSDVIDIYPDPQEDFKVKITYRNIDRLIGKKLAHEEIKEILHYLDISVEDEHVHGFTAIVPPYRVDVQREADVIEEILRIYGYDNVETSAYLSADFLSSFPEMDSDKLQSRISEMMAGNGFHEIITNSLTKPAYANAMGMGANSVEILNKLSEDLGVMRQSLIFSGLEVIAYNISHRKKNLKFFEIGKTYEKLEGKYLEKKQLAIFMTGNQQAESWRGVSTEVSFHDLSSIIRKIFNRFDIVDPMQKGLEDPKFSYGLDYQLNGKSIGQAGLLHPKLAALAGVKQAVFFASIDWPALLKKVSEKSAKERLIYQEISKFPEVRRDLSLVLDKQVGFSQVESVAKKYSDTLVKDINVFDIYEGESIGADKKAYALSFILQDTERTLTDKVIDKTMKKLMNFFEKELGAVIRK